MFSKLVEWIKLSWMYNRIKIKVCVMGIKNKECRVIVFHRWKKMEQQKTFIYFCIIFFNKLFLDGENFFAYVHKYSIGSKSFCLSLNCHKCFFFFAFQDIYKLASLSAITMHNKACLYTHASQKRNIITLQ